jgi:hypothetical protein
MEFHANRRRFLELAGPTTAAALAGCSALTGSDAESQSTPTTDAPAETRRVGLSVEPDQQALQQRQSEIQSELQSGNLTRAQAQQQFREAQTELLGEAMASFRERARERSALTVEDSVQQFGVLLVAGPPVALIDTLSIEGVVGLLPRATFEEAQSRAQTATTTETVSATETASE